MNNILEKLFAKRGIKDVNELDLEEREQFETWNKILSKEELTLEDVKQFCQTQCGIIENKWKDYDTPNTKKSELIPYHTIYKTLLSVIQSPKVARENLEKDLIQILNK